jgi:hypothetical protein
MFVQFINAHTKKPMLINTDHIRTAAQVAENMVRLAMDADHAETVEGSLDAVTEKLTNKWASQTDA